MLQHGRVRLVVALEDLSIHAGGLLRDRDEGNHGDDAPVSVLQGVP